MGSVTQQHLPVILLLGKRQKNHDEVDQWLAGSRYSTYEAGDVFQVLEQVSDFTVGKTPDVVFLHAEKVEAELAMLEHMLETSEGDSRAPVITFSDKPNVADNARDYGLGRLARQLDKLIPGNQQVI